MQLYGALHSVVKSLATAPRGKWDAEEEALDDDGGGA